MTTRTRQTLVRDKGHLFSKGIGNVRNMNLGSLDVSEAAQSDLNMILLQPTATGSERRMDLRESGSVFVVDLGSLTNTATDEFSIVLPRIDQTTSSMISSARGFHCKIIVSKMINTANKLNIVDSDYKNNTVSTSNLGIFHYGDNNATTVSCLVSDGKCCGVTIGNGSDAYDFRGAIFDIYCDGSFYYCYGNGLSPTNPQVATIDHT